MNLTLATYNIHACIGADGRFKPERIVHVLRELNADVVALQEVEHHDVDGCDLLDYLAAETGLTAVSGPTLLRRTRHYGNAILTRLPILTVNRVDLTLPGHEARGALDITLDGKGRRVQVVATHLGLMPWERRHQVRELLKLFNIGSANIYVLMGDLNEWFLWGRPLRWLHAHFKRSPHCATFPARLPFMALDRLWVHPRKRLAIVEVHASDLARMASDHLPLKGIIEM
ncbi:endonuclease/exonuclease/phosphatase family protein [Nitrosospira sp. Nsp13]|uniref:endonuclease/exonuclease/phosphatase family protein n=1 Tax=Nitrosospira sp. Nsp13 TaxID=1855332 RepID=UPI00088C9F61|nr:endonuclease/exonuclease/phosphatase family protein [Nitrosospira sp. Nsp13]SCX84949.1 Metal-dependent hydrolase, endonuclease/exonuclease/phosphatase family [Nitrosospira sp. Nsp13]